MIFLKLSVQETLSYVVLSAVLSKAIKIAVLTNCCFYFVFVCFIMLLLEMFLNVLDVIAVFFIVILITNILHHSCIYIGITKVG